MPRQAVVALQPIDLALPDLLDERRPVRANIPAQEVVTGATGFVHVPEVESQVRSGPDASEVRAVPLPLPLGRLIATDASQMGVTQAYITVYRCLGLLGVFRATFQGLFPDLDLFAFNLVQRLARLGLILLRNGQAAGRTAYRLPHPNRYEPAGAGRVAAGLLARRSRGDTARLERSCAFQF